MMRASQSKMGGEVAHGSVLDIRKSPARGSKYLFNLVANYGICKRPPLHLVGGFHHIFVEASLSRIISAMDHAINPKWVTHWPVGAELILIQEGIFAACDGYRHEKGYFQSAGPEGADTSGYRTRPRLRLRLRLRAGNHQKWGLHGPPKRPKMGQMGTNGRETRRKVRGGMLRFPNCVPCAPIWPPSVTVPD